MIRQAKSSDIEELKYLWKICFNDSDDYIDLFFNRKFIPQKTIICENDDGKVIASLYIQRYYMKVYSSSVAISYFCGIATLPEYRNKGIAKQLIFEAEEFCKKNDFDIAVLIPADINLFSYYEKFDYTQVFDKGKNAFSLSDIIENSLNLTTAFSRFDEIYNSQNYSIQKNFDDFIAIIEEWKLSKYEKKYNCWGMAKILNYEKIIKILEENISTFSLDFIKTEKIEENKALFCRLFFGYHINELEEKYKIFPQQTPVINLMLE